MAYAYYATHSVPVTLPVLIAITGITRLIILQGKEAEPSKLLFEAGAVLLLAVALAILSWASQRSPFDELQRELQRKPLTTADLSSPDPRLV